MTTWYDLALLAAAGNVTVTVWADTASDTKLMIIVHSPFIIYLLCFTGSAAKAVPV
jgi:hypothetical protein